MADSHGSRRNSRLLILLIPVLAFLGYAVIMMLRLASDTRFVSATGNWDSYSRRDTHVEVIFPSGEEDFYSRVRGGLADFVNDVSGESIGLHYLEPFPFMTPEESMYRHCEIASMAEVDAIIIAPGRSDRLAALLKQTRAEGIPVIALNSNLPEDSVDTVVGVDSFFLGVRLASMISVLPEPVRGIYFLYSSDTLLTDPGEFQKGLRTALYANDRNVQLQSSNLEEGDVFARRTIEDVLSMAPGVNLIIADSPALTLNLAQAVVEENQVGEVMIIGVGNSSDVREYLDSGIIQFIININPDEIGIKTIEAVSDLLAGRPVEKHIPVSVRIEGQGDSGGVE